MGTLVIFSWMPYLKGIDQKDEMPDGWAPQAKSFWLPDLLLVVLLFGGGIFFLMDNPLGLNLSALAAGMLLFLTLIDINYDIGNQMYSSDRGGFSQVIADGILLLMALFLGIYHLVRSVGLVFYDIKAGFTRNKSIQLNWR